jgi:hypothetical protein
MRMNAFFKKKTAAEKPAVILSRIPFTTDHRAVAGRQSF